MIQGVLERFQVRSRGWIALYIERKTAYKWGVNKERRGPRTQGYQIHKVRE